MDVSVDLQFRRACSTHQLPVFSILTQGSLGANGSPFCSNSMETSSGERINAMYPSRGGRLIVTPPACSDSQIAYISSTRYARWPKLRPPVYSSRSQL